MKPKPHPEQISAKDEIAARIAKENRADAAAWRYLTSRLTGLINHAGDKRTINVSSVKRHLKHAIEIQNAYMEHP